MWKYTHFKVNPLFVGTFEGDKSVDFSVRAILMWKMSNLIPLLTF